MSKNVDTISYLSPLQHGMLHHSQLAPASGVYVEQFSCVLSGALDTERFERAWAAVVQRHDVLKTLFIRLQEERPLQVVRKQVVLPLRRQDWRALDAAQQDARFEALLAEDRSRGFDPSVAPLMRLHLADLGNQRHRFLWSYHHAILDGWSMPILLGEVFALYRSGAASLPPPPADFRHYLAWLRKQDMDEVRSFWRDALKGFRSPMRWAPSMAPAPGPAGEATVRRLATVHGSMDGVWLERAAALCRAQRITLNTLCQGAWALLLSLHGDADDVVHGMVVSGRSGGFAGAENMVGLFINTLPTRVRIDAELPLMDWLRRLQAGTQQAERLAHSPLAEVLACSELPRQQALFDSLYVFENYPGQAAFRSVVEACGLRVEDLRAVEETNYPLALIVLPGGGLQWQLTYDTARFSAAAVERLVGQYGGLLGRFVDGGDVPLHCIGLRASGPLVGEACTPAIVPADSLAALLWRQASSAPRRLALAGSSGCIDQAALSERIERGLLRWAQLGYGPGDRVLLLSEDPACALVMLLSGLAHGIDCVLPDADRSLPELFDAAGAAWGHEGLQGCVRGDAGLPAPVGLRVDVFEQQAAHMPTAATATALSDPSRGACSLISREDDGAWTLLRYTQAQLLHAADAFARRQPPGETRDLAVMHSPLRPANLWTVLLGLCAGLTVHTLMPSKDVHWLELLRTAGRRWHGVQLDAEATRALDRGAETTAPLAVDRWLVDAVSLSPCGARRLRELAPRATVVRELRWPAHSLVHAASVVE
ncbi:MAG TPA: condensation domain-containing protein, partial [Albitalea sp.]|nr:condensation domain-containing protein [Albitalea sp.]